MKAIHTRPRPDPPTVASLQDQWAELVVELGTTTDPGEQRLIRQLITDVEQQAAQLIERKAER